MIVVAATGAIHYAVQFPGEGVSGDFLPPGDGALDAYTPPMYIVMVMRPTGVYTLNKMLALAMQGTVAMRPLGTRAVCSRGSFPLYLVGVVLECRFTTRLKIFLARIFRDVA